VSFGKAWRDAQDRAHRHHEKPHSHHGVKERFKSICRPACLAPPLEAGYILYARRGQVFGRGRSWWEREVERQDYTGRKAKEHELERGRLAPKRETTSDCGFAGLLNCVEL